MSDNTRNTRTWRPEVVAEPVAQVQDEAVRAVLLARQGAGMGGYTREGR